jgi:histidine triad (HIT) family protein
MSTIFSKIIAREIPAHFVYEDDFCVVIMDTFPSVTGQVLIVPKIEVDYAFDLPDEVYQHLMIMAKKVAIALDIVFATDRTCLVVEGFEVPHVHVKLYPIQGDGLNFKVTISKTTEGNDEELAMHAEKIADQLIK